MCRTNSSRCSDAPSPSVYLFPQSFASSLASSRKIGVRKSCSVSFFWVRRGTRSGIARKARGTKHKRYSYSLRRTGSGYIQLGDSKDRVREADLAGQFHRGKETHRARDTWHRSTLRTVQRSSSPTGYVPNRNWEVFIVDIPRNIDSEFTFGVRWERKKRSHVGPVGVC